MSSSNSQTPPPSSNVLNPSPKEKGKRQIGEVLSGQDSGSDGSSSNDSSYKSTRSSAHPPGREAPRVVYLPELVDCSGLYPCPDCDKWFHKPKALSGHKRSHSAPRDCREMVEVRNRPTREEREVAATLLSLAMGKGRTEEEKVRDQEDLYVVLPKKVEFKIKYYKCLDCHKIFKSKQALGGHKASHTKRGHLVRGEGLPIPMNNQGDNSPPPPPPPPSPPPPKRMHMFDLNLPPPIEDDENEMNDEA